MKNRLMITAFCCFIGFGTLWAQHEFSINAFGGLQPVNLTLFPDGTYSNDFGGGAGIGYNYNFNDHWSIGTGADLSFYGMSIAFDRINTSHTDFDAVENFTFIAELSKYKEDISALLLEIPLTVRYSLPVGNNSLRFTGGCKFGLPLSTKYTASAGTLKTRGGYYDEDQVYHDIPEVFVNEPMTEHTGNWAANISIQLTLEAAYRFAIGKKNGLAFGIYFNYGLNNMQGKNDEYPIAFNVNGNKPYTSNSILNSGFVSTIKPSAVGLKLRFDLGR